MQATWVSELLSHLLRFSELSQGQSSINSRRLYLERIMGSPLEKWTRFKEDSGHKSLFQHCESIHLDISGNVLSTFWESLIWRADVDYDSGWSDPNGKSHFSPSVHISLRSFSHDKCAIRTTEMIAPRSKEVVQSLMTRIPDSKTLDRKALLVHNDIVNFDSFSWGRRSIMKAGASTRLLPRSWGVYWGNILSWKMPRWRWSNDIVRYIL